MIKYINRKKLLEEIDKRAEKMIPSSDGNHYTSVEVMKEIIDNFDTVKVNPVINAWFLIMATFLLGILSLAAIILNDNRNNR